MKLNEITKTGFYCVVDDTERSYIFEVLNNTDKNWLKENPKATLLIDEWIYDYTDYDDRKVYSTSGNLVSLCFETSNAQVYRIEDTKYKIYGNAGLYLIEDKPTYKELFQAEREKVKELEQKLSFQIVIEQRKEEEKGARIHFEKLAFKYKQALDEIEKYTKSQNDGFGNAVYGISKESQNKIIDIISKAKGENNE